MPGKGLFSPEPTPVFCLFFFLFPFFFNLNLLLNNFDEYHSKYNTCTEEKDVHIHTVQAYRFL